MPTSVSLASASSPYVTAYDWDSGFGTKYSDPSVIASDVSYYQLVATNTAVIAPLLNSPRVTAYQWTGGVGFGSKYSDPSSSPIGMNAYSITKTPGAVIIGGNGSPYIYAYDWSDINGFGTEYSDPQTLPAAFIRGLKFNEETSDVIAACFSSSPYVSAYPWSDVSGFGTKYSDPSTPPLSGSRGVDTLTTASPNPGSSTPLKIGPRSRISSTNFPFSLIN